MTASTRARVARRALPPLAALLLLALPATASAVVTLDWTTANVFNSAAAPNERTWLGHVTNPTPFSGANGTATVADGAR